MEKEFNEQDDQVVQSLAEAKFEVWKEKFIKRLKEEIDKTKSSDKSGEWIISRKITLKKIIDKIFKEEFGDKLI